MDHCYVDFCICPLSDPPHDCLRMLKYMSDVRYVASHGDGWIKYDEEYRLRISWDVSLHWGRVDTVLWVLYVKAGKQALNAASQQFHCQGGTKT